MSCGADSTANALITSLLAGKTFTVPNVDLDGADYLLPADGALADPVSKILLADLTTKEVNGGGVFDALMRTVSVHLKGEFEANRITGKEYTTAYIEMTGQALSAAVQFLLGKESAYWQAIAAQQQALRVQTETVTAKVALATSKLIYATNRFQAYTAESEYALAKMRLATEDQNYCNLIAQKAGIEAQTAQTVYQNTYLLPSQKAMVDSQKLGQDAQNAQILYQTANILPAQKTLTIEQAEAARAQTLNNRSDGATVVGMLGKQKELYTQQITSFQRDSETKAAKLFTDAWITMKTIDEGLTPPTPFANASLTDILNKIKNNNDLD